MRAERLIYSHFLNQAFSGTIEIGIERKKRAGLAFENKKPRGTAHPGLYILTRFHGSLVGSPARIRTTDAVVNPADGGTLPAPCPKDSGLFHAFLSFFQETWLRNGCQQHVPK